MNIQGYLIILQRQLQQKWGRFLLASGGIMVGIWAISLTTSLSLGLSQTIVTAINSQPFAREISLTKTESNQISFFEVTTAPVFMPLSLAELQNISREDSRILAISPDTAMNIFVQTSKASAQTKCVEQDIVVKQQKAVALAKLNSQANSQANPQNPGQINGQNAQNQLQTNSSQTTPVVEEDFVNSCKYLTVSSTSLQNFYETNRSKWLGKTNNLADNEIAICYQCGDENLGEKLGAQKPEDLLGKKIKIEYQRAPDLYEAGKPLNVASFDPTQTALTKSNPLEFTIAAVINDKGDNIFGNPPIYFNYIHFQNAFQTKNPDKNVANYGALQNTVFIDKYTNLQQVVNNLQAKKYLAFSIALTLIGAIETAFLVLTWVLAAFGFIALVASIFGIINVMTISVLERKKEIGIMKALGARDRDIFTIFFVESSLLGVFGWLLGIGLSLAISALISFLFQKVILTNPAWMDNLKTLNITDFSPAFPWWLFLITFLLAVFFTSLSGVFPAISAARQNPVDVLRSE